MKAGTVSQRTNEPLPAILLALIQPTSEPNPDAFSHPDDVVDMISVARRTNEGSPEDRLQVFAPCSFFWSTTP